MLEELKTEVNPQAVRHMAQLSEELEEAREVLDRVAEKERKRYVKEEFYQNPYRSGAAVMETKGRGKKRSSL